MEKLFGDLRKRLPGARSELIRPRDPRGRWTLEVEHEGWLAVVVWLPLRGFALTAGPVDEEAGYGENPDQVYPGDPDELVGHVVQLLRSRRRTSPPRSVVLKELRARCGLTQVELAERLAVQQGTVSKLERSAHLDVGKLSDAVRAMGGELELWVRFPDEAPVKLSPPAALPRAGAKRRRRRG